MERVGDPEKAEIGGGRLRDDERKESRPPV
jgi:hypothetical protein